MYLPAFVIAPHLHFCFPSLPRNQVPEWAGSYIDYKRLKKLIKTAADTAVHNGDQVDLAGGFTDPQRPFVDLVI